MPKNENKTLFFFDWAPIKNKESICSGGHIRRYYAFKALSKKYRVISFRNQNEKINISQLTNLIWNDAKIWVEYPCGRWAHLFVLLASFLPSKKITLNVHDLILQAESFDAKRPFYKNIQLSFAEKLILRRANTLILAWPGLLELFAPKSEQKIILMPPGIEKSEICNDIKRHSREEKVALYFGGLRRKEALQIVMNSIIDIENWKLHLVGKKEGQKIVNHEDIVYLGSLPHSRLDKIIENCDVILIPLPKNEYTEKIIPIKTPYALNSCRPIIVTKLSGICDFISKNKLEENVIYIENWNYKSLGVALEKAVKIKINAEDTKNKLLKLDWDSRFEKVIDIVFDDDLKSEKIIYI